MANPVNIDSPENRPSWLPANATLVKAAGEPCDESLQDEYSTAPLERQVKFAESMRAIDEAERQAWRESFGIRL